MNLLNKPEVLCGADYGDILDSITLYWVGFGLGRPKLTDTYPLLRSTLSDGSGPSACFRLSPSCPKRRLHIFPLASAGEALPQPLDTALLIRAPEGLEPPRSGCCPAHTISQSDCRQVIGPSLPPRLRLGRPTSFHLNATALRCSHGTL
jgi:hypothetical protein